MNRLFCFHLGKSNNTSFVYETNAYSEALNNYSEAMDTVLSPEENREHAEGRLAIEQGTAFQKRDLATEQESMQTLNEGGDAHKYLDTFSMSPLFDSVCQTLRAGMESGGKYNKFNFADWPSNPQMAATLFEDLQGNGFFMPRGEGRVAFVHGLNASRESTEYFESHNVLKGIVAKLKERFDLRNNAIHDVEEQGKDPLAGHTLTGYANNIINKFNNDSPGGKLILGGTIIGGALALWFSRDKKLFGSDVKLKDIMLWGSMAAGVNYLSGAASSDGKTILNRFGVGTDVGVEDLNDLFIQGYALNEGMGEDKNKLRAFKTSMNTDVKLLFDLYEDASLATVHGKEMNTQRLGFAPGQVDGKKLYEIMHGLVRQTAKNQAKYVYMNRNGITDERKIDRAELGKFEQKYLDPSNESFARGLFKDKYLNGPGSGSKMSLMDAVVNEYATDKDALVGQATTYRRDTLPELIKAKTKAAVDETVEWANDTMFPFVRHSTEALYGIGQNMSQNRAEYFGWANRNMVEPVWRYMKGTYGEIEPVVTDYIYEKAAFFQEGDVEAVANPNLAVRVPKRGEAIVMGVPGFALDIGRDENGRKKIKIGVVEFDGSKDIRGNQAANDQLATVAKAAAQMKYEAASHNFPYLAGKTITWNLREKNWTIAGVTTAPFIKDGVTLDTGTAVNATMSFNKEGKTVLKVNGRNIEEMQNAPQEIFEGRVEQAINNDATYKEVLGGLPVKIESTAVDAVHGWIATGTIAGMTVRMVPTTGGDIANGISFVDDAGDVGRLEKIELSDAKKQKAFIYAKIRKIAGSVEFRKPFDDIDSLVDNTTTLPFKRTQLRHMLDYKQQETLFLFEKSVFGTATSPKTAADMIPALQQTVEVCRNQLETILHNMQAAQPTEENFVINLKKIQEVNYINNDYNETFKDYRTMIGNYDLKNIVTASDDRYGVYNALMWIWNVNTYANRVDDTDPANQTATGHGTEVNGSRTGTLTVHTKTQIQNEVIDKVKAKLDRLTANGETLTMEKMGTVVTPEDAIAWLNN